MELEMVSVKLPKPLIKRVRLKAVQDDVTLQELMAALIEAGLKGIK